jgi:hypothetical protein
MIAALIAKLGLSVAQSFAKRYWKPLLFGAIGLTVIATLAVQHWRINSLTAARAKDQLAIEAALVANQANTAAIAELAREAEIDRKVTAAAIQRADQIATTAQRHVQEIQNDPGANVPAGPEFDDLGNRLRDIDQSRHGDARRVP